LNKEDLDTRLESVGKNCVLGLAAVTLFKNQEAWKLLENTDLEVGNYRVDLNRVVKQLKNNKKGGAIEEYIKMLFRALLKESYELVKDYCKDTRQMNLLKSENWYHFARIIRNCLSHDFRIVLSKQDKSILPVSWNNHTISADMDGQDLDLNFFSFCDAIELIDDIQIFSKKRLA